MKQILYFLGLVVLLSGIFTSCKTDSLEAMRNEEVAALDKYVKDNNLTDSLDVSGIYFSLDEPSTDTTLIRSGFKVKLEFNVTLLNGTAIYYRNFTTDDGKGNHFEPYAFYVDSSDAIVNQEYVQQIAGLHIALKKMHIGDRATIVIPSELAFKAVDMSSIGIPRFSTLLATVYIDSAYAPDNY